MKRRIVVYSTDKNDLCIKVKANFGKIWVITKRFNFGTKHNFNNQRKAALKVKELIGKYTHNVVINHACIYIGFHE